MQQPVKGVRLLEEERRKGELANTENRKSRRTYRQSVTPSEVFLAADSLEKKEERKSATEAPSRKRGQASHGERCSRLMCDARDGRMLGTGYC
jgi:hypothetical protein